MSEKSPLLELENVSKDFGNVKALQNVSTKVIAGQVTCVLGDNGAGKSTFIKIISGLHKPSGGKYKFEGHEVAFESPREARALGIATVYQDLAMAPLMSVWRNFFLGSEPVRRFGPINLLDTKFARKTSMFAILISLSARFLVANAKVWRLRALFTSAHECLFWTNRHQRLACVNQI
jgi:simple sugar transport system ATP-binding protein